MKFLSRKVTWSNAAASVQNVTSAWLRHLLLSQAKVTSMQNYTLHVVEKFGSLSACIFSASTGWTKISGTFTQVSSTLHILQSPYSPQGLMPRAHLGDGYLDVLCVKDSSKFNLLRFLFLTRFFAEKKVTWHSYIDLQFWSLFAVFVLLRNIFVSQSNYAAFILTL